MPSWIGLGYDNATSMVSDSSITHRTSRLSNRHTYARHRSFLEIAQKSFHRTTTVHLAVTLVGVTQISQRQQTFAVPMERPKLMPMFLVR